MGQPRSILLRHFRRKGITPPYQVETTQVDLDQLFRAISDHPLNGTKIMNAMRYGNLKSLKWALEVYLPLQSLVLGAHLY